MTISMQTKARLALEFKQKTDRTTVISQQYYCLPLQIMEIFQDEERYGAWLYLLNPSGGMLEGDRFDLSFVLHPGAAVRITTPAANKIYKSETDAAVQRLSATLAAHAMLEYTPKHTIPYANANYHQLNTFHLAENSTLFTYDTLTPGRMARGESFQYTRCLLEQSIYIENCLVCKDRSDIRPDRLDVRAMGAFAGKQILSAAYMYDARLPEDAIDRLYAAVAEFADIEIGFSALTGGLIVMKLLTDKVSVSESVLKSVQRCFRSFIAPTTAQPA
ncbi:MAG: urease accessory protein UreD [Peptococcaceae bacterium]|jgi:urease accessory protein|nr:urease accessory protein UreD [Peptococcaceae bacterium]